MNVSYANAMATGIIAFVTVLGLMTGLYFNLRTSSVSSTSIFFLEFTFLSMIWVFAAWLKKEIRYYENQY